MKMSLPTLLWAYVALSLAVVLVTWLLFSLRRRKLRRGLHRVHTCPDCGGEVRVKSELTFIRCQRCGAKIKLDDLRY